MRIIGGTLKGRRLKAPAGLATRPTSEKVREALFDILGRAVEDALFVDLFSGTGAIAIEAASRGAAEVVAVESSRKALGVLKANVGETGCETSVRILAMPAVKALRLLKETGGKADVVFAAPPYRDAAWPDLLAGLGEALRWSEGARLVVEHLAGREPATPKGFSRGRSYRYGDTGLTVFVWDGLAATPLADREIPRGEGV